MQTGVVIKQQGSAAKELPGPVFDPRPWPFVVLMLAGLIGVFFALRAAAPEDAAAGGQSRVERGKRGDAGQPGARGERGTPSGQATTATGAVVVPALAEMKETLEQGVTLSFAQGAKSDVRAARVISLYVPAGEAPSPFLSPGAFEATWSGFLNMRLRGEVSFSVLGRGKVAVRVGGKTVLEADGEDFRGKAVPEGGPQDFTGKSSPAIKMEKGKNPIEVVYTSPEKGDAWVRVLWASREFQPEPVQPTALSHDVSDKRLRESMRVREGRELWAELRCARCHADAAGVRGGSPMPELSADAPDLTGAGARLKQPWMAAWISDPRKLRADASMPRVFHGAAAPAEAADVAAYLATLGKPAAVEAKEADDEAVAQGGQVFAGLGCIGCHTKPDAEEADKEGVRVPLKFVNAKFQPGGLRAWLLNPQAHYAWSRMPNFRLNDLEADRLVAYLGKKATGEVAAEANGDAGKGRVIFEKAGCLNCHLAKVDRPKESPLVEVQKGLRELAASSDWARGCLAADDAARGRAPDFALAPEQRGALAAFAAGGVETLNTDVVTEFAERSVRRMQCIACHSRDEVEDRWSTVADEVGDLAPPEANEAAGGDAAADPQAGPRLFVPRGLGHLRGGEQVAFGGDQQRPAITWAGEKLRPEWAAKMIDGTLTYKPRYWMRARMPGFGGRGDAIARGLAQEHGCPPRGEAQAKPKPEAVELGQKLVSRNGGFQCISCHSAADSKAIGAFEAYALNFSRVTERLNHDFYIRWMRKPMRFQPGTKMMQFSEDGKSTLREILGGDADKQFEAIWEFLLTGEKMTPPE